MAMMTPVGQRLAHPWFATSSTLNCVTTCIKGTVAVTDWASLAFLAGDDRFPEWQPSTAGPQEIAGIDMVETATRDE
ncbi:Aste57867_9713 [Aphanomyces stellatus]|uniref:Aste57867_9713 protein n=1 Tax=Aphanomyces stellatus TaxID=120398 RepID=A0A485KNK9_9STRA|nr:hypothetical protein As57867_009675 [Aphanomyces stellatus]VFT86592.1 Aste57867_9713 [Aphanomyces stellatus]